MNIYICVCVCVCVCVCMYVMAYHFLVFCRIYVTAGYIYIYKTAIWKILRGGILNPKII